MLRQLRRLAQALGLVRRISSSSISEDVARFGVEIVRLILQTGGDREQVYEFFGANVERLDEMLLLELPNLFTTLLQRNDPSMIAATFVWFGNLIQQFPFGSRMLNLELGIAAYEQVLQVYTRDAFPADWAMTQHNLATAYSDRIRGDRAENLEGAITAYEQALQVRTRDTFPTEWASTQNNLAAAYSDRIRGGRAENLEGAITAYEQALQVRTRDAFPTEWAETQNNLASAYGKRIRGGRAENLERAITAYEQVLQVYTRDAFPERWAMTQKNLATAYSDRIRGERAENLEWAITIYEQALQVYTRDTFPTEWASTQNDLAIAYSERIRGEKAENLERAIATYEQALQVYTHDAFPERWAGTQNNLASAYNNRIRGERADNLEQAITASQQALQVYTHDAFPERWAGTQKSLGNAYLYRIRGERADNLEQAIASYQQVLQVYTRDAFPEDWAGTQHNLGNAYLYRIRGERADNLKQAITASQQALQVRTRDAFPKDCRQTAQNLGNLHFQEKSWAAAVDTYQIATAAAENLYKAAISYAGKGDELKATADLPRRLAYAQAQLGNLQTAVLTLEQSRARGLSESLDRDRADLAQLQTRAPNLYTDYQNITQQLRNLESRDRMVSTNRDRVPEDLLHTTRKLRQALDQTIAQIRQIPSYEGFLTPTQWKDIAITLRQDNPLVYLVTTPNGGMVLIVTVDAIKVLWLNDLTETQLIDLLNQTWFTAYRQSQTDRQAWYDAIDTTTRELWDLLMGQLVQQIKALGFERITLIPTGYLSLLPLHAAWTKDDSRPNKRRYALDDIHITYAPNAKSLTATQAIAQRTGSDSILAIDNPLQDLPNSSREVTAAIATFPQHKILKHEAATINSVLVALPHYNILHLSCHGTANLREPLISGLAMSDGLLTLRDLLDLRLSEQEQGDIRLAVLSACETGLTGIELVDEAIGLPTGLLQAGVAGVVASLWSVSDLSTMMLLIRFYDLWRKDGINPSEALRQAQVWVRDTTNKQKYDYFKSKLSDPLSSQGQSGITKAFLNEFMLNYVYPSGWEARDFAHPFHWAAFSYVGV